MWRENNPWPLALRGEMGAYSTGTGEADFRTILRYAPSSSRNYSHNQGFLLANYLAGTNAASQQIQWPRFPGSSTQGFAGKYSKRQMDSIVAQILSIGSKAISSDYPIYLGLHRGTDWPSLYGRAVCVSRLAKPAMGDRRGALPEGHSNVHASCGVPFGWEPGIPRIPRTTPHPRPLSISGSSGGCQLAISADIRSSICRPPDTLSDSGRPSRP